MRCIEIYIIPIKTLQSLSWTDTWDVLKLVEGYLCDIDILSWTDTWDVLKSLKADKGLQSSVLELIHEMYWNVRK